MFAADLARFRPKYTGLLATIPGGQDSALASLGWASVLASRPARPDRGGAAAALSRLAPWAQSTRRGTPDRNRSRRSVKSGRACGQCYATPEMTLDSLSPSERGWLVDDELRWQRARRIAERHGHVDVSGVYHVLRNLEKSPSERLKAALTHGRLFRFNGR